MTPLPTVSFWIDGIARTAGSKNAFALRRKDGSLVLRRNGSPVIVVTDDSGDEGKSWRTAVVNAAVAARPFERLLDGPISVAFAFYRARLRSHYGTGRNAHVLRPTAAPYPATKPDLLKTARAIEDALTGVIWRDDAPIVTELLLKRWGPLPGVRVSVWAEPEAAALLPEAKQLALGLG